jgi:16S rRNA (guanine527-N7)-methyltransferase
MPERPSALFDVLAESARLGFLGPGPVEDGARHARGFLGLLRPAATLLDLGSGGGLPGLVLAEALPATSVVLLDASQTRTDFLRRAVGRLGLADRVRVVTGSAELVGRDPDLRGSFDAVVARSFGPPATVAEGAAPLLRIGGQLVVSEPPGAVSRWPAEPLAELGLVVDVVTAGFASLRQVEACPERFPRRRLRPALF